MACAGVFCNAFSQPVAATCMGHRPPCPTNRPWNPNPSLIAGNIISSDLDNLRTNLNAEITAYNSWQQQNGQPLYSNTNPASPDGSFTAISLTDVKVRAVHPNQVSALMNQITPTGVNKAIGNSILALDWVTLRNSYEVIRQNCICNSDCACNAVCACHNDCGCNYSDINLKTNIKYIL